MEDQTHVIAVIRHAKAESQGPTDFERQLAPRGRADAAALGAWLRSQGVTPDRVLVSAATRTQQTWEAIRDAADWAIDAEVDPSLYSAGTDTALDILREVPDEARTVLVVGHNPTMASLAQLLDDGEGDLEASNEMTSGYPTSAVTLFAYVGAWADLGEGSASISAYHVGRG